MKRNIGLLSGIIMLLVLFAGCSSSGAVDIDRIERDLEAFTNVLNGDRIVDSVGILEQVTEKKASDVITIAIASHDEEVAYTRYYRVFYEYAEKAWKYDTFQEYHSLEWEKSPLRGVHDEMVERALNEQSLVLSEDYWSLRDTITSINSIEHQTQLEQKTDTITVDISLQKGLEVASGQVQLGFHFDYDAGWILDKTDGFQFLTDFTTSLLPEADFRATEAELLEYASRDLTKHLGMWSWLYKAEDVEVTSFSVVNVEIYSNATYQTYECALTLDVQGEIFESKEFITYSYNQADSTWQIV